MNEQLISIIVAVYNVEKYLNKCVESIINQTYRELEIILVDDGSKDNSGKMCDEWANKDSRIHVIHKPNGGLSDARNYGLEVAQGRWIGFIDGDDYIKSDMYERLFDNRVENGMTVCGYYIVENNQIIPCYGIDKMITQKEAVNLYLKNEWTSISSSKFTYFGSYAWNKLYDISVFKYVRYPKHKKFEDMYIILELLYHCSLIQIIPQCEYYYIQRENSITHLKSIHTDALVARKKQKKELEEFWGIQDKRIHGLLGLSYISILKKYAIVSSSEREKYNDLRNESWNNLNQIGYSECSFKTKIKLFFCRVVPDFYRFLYKLNEKLKYIK